MEPTRGVLLTGSKEIAVVGLREQRVVGIASVAEDGMSRQVDGLAVTLGDIADGCLGVCSRVINALALL